MRFFQTFQEVRKMTDYNEKKIVCLKCKSQKLTFVEIINISKKGLKGKPILAEAGYEKNTFHSTHLCQDCGRVSSYPVMEAKS